MKIVFLDANTLGGENIDAFKEFGEVVVYEKSAENEVLERLKDANVAVINKIKMSREVMQNCPDLKLILISATGMNTVDLVAAKELGVVVKNVAGYSTKSVAQHTYALLLALMNETLYYNEYTKNNEWSKSELFCDYSRRIHTIEGKTWGIIGLGAIGRDVAKIAQMFGANVIYTSLSGKNNNPDFKQTSLEELLKTSDIISIHAPLNDKSYKLIGEKELAMMKDNAYLLNLGRGGIIDEVALAKAIDNKNIRVGLDVVEFEPMRADNPLLKVSKKQNLIITPHIAWTACECVTRLVGMMVNNLRDFLNGK